MSMTITSIKEIALNLGYVITKTKKNEIVAEFLSQQNSAQNG